MRYRCGDWLYSYMKNCSGGTCVQNTYVTTMINGNGNQASFNESWKSSQYTGL